MMKEPFKLALSMTLFYWLALWMDWGMPKYGALAIALISVGTAGASIEKGVLRIVGTTVGTGVGMFALALFAQDRWLMLAFLAAYLVFIGYRLQASRVPYAWFVAGFMPPLVWSSTYGDVDSTFHYATFRYLETSAGVIVYALVGVVLWPKRAGDALPKQGADVWSGLRSLYRAYRRQLEGEALSDEPDALRARLEAAMGQMMATFQAAGADTSWVRERRRALSTLRVDLRAFHDALALWRESIDDCRRLPLERLLPRLDAVLGAVDARLARVGELWEARFTGDVAPDESADTDDSDGLLERRDLSIDPGSLAALSHFDRATILGFAQQVEVLERASRDLLHTVRVLTDRAAVESLDARSLPPDPEPAPGLDHVRLTRALVPPLCLIAAWFFWIFLDPPTGPNIPNMASVFSLLFLMAPARALRLLPVLLGLICVAVAPVYFFVMPRLGTGAGLLSLIFGYTLLFGLIGARKPVIQVLGLAMFVMMTGISNDQVYSFMGLVNGGTMFVLSLTIVGVVQMLLSPARPEQAFLGSVCRFLRGGARFVGAFGGHGEREIARGRAVRKRVYESLIVSEARQLRAIEKQLDHEGDPECGPEQVKRLLAAFQSITRRLRALELAHDRLARRSVEWSDTFVAVAAELCQRVTGLFDRWSRFERVDEQAERTALERLGRDLRRQLDGALARSPADRLDDAALADLYAMLGCARGLIHAVAETHSATNRIDWDQWTEARF